MTPYLQKVKDNVIDELVGELEKSADYVARREEVRRYNSSSAVLKRGIALTPVKFGISFTATHLNQAGALINVYTDGTVHLNHGGTEMGQGLFTMSPRSSPRNSASTSIASRSRRRTRARYRMRRQPLRRPGPT